MQQDWATLACPSNSGSTFWSHEWDKHGTCSESVLDQHAYFAAALNLKSKLDLLQILQSAGIIQSSFKFKSITTPFFLVFHGLKYPCNPGINPDGGVYSLSSIRSTIGSAIGHTPWVECNVDQDGNSQLYQIYVCVENSGSDLIDCPVFPRGKCGSSIEFPSF